MPLEWNIFREMVCFFLLGTLVLNVQLYPCFSRSSCFFNLLLETWNLVHSLGGSIGTFFTCSLNLERKLHVKAYLYCGLLYKIIHLNIIPYNAGRSYDAVNTFFRLKLAIFIQNKAQKLILSKSFTVFILN